MADRIVINRKFFPHTIDSGVTFMLALWLLMDRLGASSFAFSIYWVMVCCMLIINVLLVLTQKNRTPMWEPPEHYRALARKFIVDAVNRMPEKKADDQP